MPEWRIGRGWSDAELARRLAETAHLQRAFEGEDHEMTVEAGWSTHASEAVIAREPPGEPAADGPFVRAWQLVTRYAFSDPRIVRAHFDRNTPLEGRRLLLEAQALGVHLLGPVVIHAVRSGEDGTVVWRGFRYDALEGHFERGHEWFVVSKDRSSGEVRFRIQAAWQRGELSNSALRLGFRLVVRRYQRAWHRLAHLRLRAMLGSEGLSPLPQPRRLVQRRRTPSEPDPRVIGRREPVPGEIAWEEEERAGSPLATREEKPTMNHLWNALSMGALAGARSMLAPAVASRILARRERREDSSLVRDALASDLAVWALPVLAVGEMLADKSSEMPARTSPLPLAGRVLSGAITGSALAPPGRALGASVTGAAGAALASLVLGELRSRAGEHMGSGGAGLAEDALALGAAWLMLRERPAH